MGETMIQTDIEDAEYLGRAKQPRGALNMIKVGNKEFAASLSRAVAITGRTGMLPILACVMLTTKDGALTIEANNMELALRDEIAAQCVNGQSLCVNATLLKNTIDRFPSGAETSLEISEMRVIVRCGGSRVTLGLLPVDEFPAFATGAGVRFTMESTTLAKMLTRVRPFISNEETRYYLCGVHMFIETKTGDKFLRAEATNAVEFAMVREAIPEGGEIMPSIILPTPAIVELLKLLGEGTVALQVSETKVAFTVGRVVLMSKLIDGSFPDCDRIIPRQFGGTLSVRQAALQSALALTRVIDAGRQPHVRITMDKDGAALSSVLENNETEATLSEGDFTFSGDPLSIAFFNRSLTNIAAVMGKDVEISFVGPDAPCVARDPADDSILCVAMATRW